MTTKSQGRDPIIFKAAIELFLNFNHCPTQLAGLIYTDFTVSYRDAFGRLHVCLKIIMFTLYSEVRLFVSYFSVVFIFFY